MGDPEVVEEDPISIHGRDNHAEGRAKEETDENLSTVVLVLRLSRSGRRLANTIEDIDVVCSRSAA